MSFSLLLHFLPVLSLETSVCAILKFSGVIRSIGSFLLFFSSKLTGQIELVLSFVKIRLILVGPIMRIPKMTIICMNRQIIIADYIG